jgi:hypothetical protein
MPNVASIDFAFDPDVRPPRGVLARLLAPGRFPELRHLRLWREEPGERVLFPMLHEIAAAPQLTHLRLPALRSKRDVAQVQAAIDRLPALHDVEIARAYHCFIGIERELGHASARIRLPPVSAWPPMDMIEVGGILWIQSHGVRIDVLVELMEGQHLALPADARDAWDRFWHAVANLGWRGDSHREELLPAAVMSTAFDEVDTDDLAVHAVSDELAHRSGSLARPDPIRWRDPLRCWRAHAACRTMQPRPTRKCAADSASPPAAAATAASSSLAVGVVSAFAP